MILIRTATKQFKVASGSITNSAFIHSEKLDGGGWENEDPFEDSILSSFYYHWKGFTAD